MKARLSLLFLLFCLICTATAQEGLTLSGKITDAGGEPLAGAQVTLLTDSNRLLKTEITDTGGVFSFLNLSTSSYLLKAAFSGMESYASEKITLTESKVLPQISLKSNTKSLGEVSVRAQKPFVEVKADRIVVNVENSITSAGSSVLDVLRRSPGVTVDQNDALSLKGKNGVQVMLDGKLTPMSGENLTNLLKSMPAEAVGQIELISNPSARYDAAGTAGIINIKTRRDKRAGLNGSLNTFYSQGVYPKAGGGGMLSYRGGKLMLNASYNYGYRKGFNHLTLYRSFFENGAFQNAYDQDNNSVFRYQSHNAALGLDYNLSAKTTVGLNGNLDIFGYPVEGRNFSRVLGADREVVSYFSTRNNSETKNQNASLNLNLRHNFDSAGRQLSVDADYGQFTTGRDQLFITRYLATSGAEYLPAYLLSGNQDGQTAIYTLKADYTHPLQNGLRLETGVKSSYVKQDNNVAFYDQSTGTPHYDSGKSNHFIYTENINAAYLNGAKDWPKWSAQVGLRIEQTRAEGLQEVNNERFDRAYTQLFPSFAVQRHLSETHDLGLSLSRRITRPNYQQLNPFKYYLDPSTYATGYPFLQPELTYNIELSHTWKQRFVTTLSYSYLTAPITEVIQPSDDTAQKRVTVQTTKNLDYQHFVSLSGSYPFKIAKWWTNITNLNLYYSQFSGNIAQSPLDLGRVTLNVYTNNTFTLGNDWSAELGGFYQSKQVYGYMQLNPVWALNAGLQKHLWAKKATLKFSANDIFWKSYPSALSEYASYTETFTAQRETRQFTVSFTYRFGKQANGPMRRRSGAEDEKRRAASGSA